MNKNIKIFLNYFLGPALFLWVGWSVWKQVQLQPDFEIHLKSIIGVASGKKAWILWVVVALMLVNWGIEARKWQLMLKVLQRISFFHSFKAILSGVAFSMNTPNRVGEYGGRVLFIEPEKRFPAVSLTIAASFSQLLITCAMGSLGLFFITENISAAPKMESLRLGLPILKMVIIITTVVGFVIYLRLGWLVRIAEKIPLLKRFISRISIIENVPTSILLRTLLLSLFRFVVFSMQYCLMLDLMGVEIGWWQGFWTVSVLFLMLATVPTIALLELGLRWEYSIVLFGLFSDNVIGMYAAATGIWLINLVIPALTGSLFMLGLRLYKFGTPSGWCYNFIKKQGLTSQRPRELV